ncbi:MAG: 3-deoxy-manno-octulosonate cytidylyltransferase [Kiritimatiellia bacterium]|nr:3-deoxy-manno-octulosonate cytidylyltransferase [Kiritimatiellia bacterium]
MKQRKLKALGIIPARWGSTRFPGKSLTPICGRPLIQWVIERASKATALDKVIVATDDRRIADTASACGVEAVMTSADHHSGTDRVAEAAAKYAAEIIVNIQGDEPTIDPVLINKLVKIMIAERKWDMATAASRISPPSEAGNPSLCKVVFNAEGQALYFSRLPIPFIREKNSGPAKNLFWRHIGIYLYRKKFLARFVAEPPCSLELAESLEQLRALHIGARIKVVQTSDCGIGIDTPADIAAAEAALKFVKRERDSG